MCTIIGGFIKDAVDSSILKKEICELYNMVLLKGGDYTNIIFLKDGHLDEESIKDYEDFQQMFIDRSKANFKKFLIFSRMTPEMELETPLKFQPYKTLFDKFILSHGTIPIGNDFSDIIDTEIFRFDKDISVSLEKTISLKGKVSLIEYNPESEMFIGVHNGLGLNTVDRKTMKYLTNINVPNSYYIQPNKFTILLKDSEINGVNEKLQFSKIPEKLQLFEELSIVESEKFIPDAIISLCSGGMDTIFSTFNYIEENGRENTPVELLYFDWGTAAAKEELQGVKNFKDYISSCYPDLLVSALSIDTKDAFKNILQVGGMETTRIQDGSTVPGGEHEAESAISYVPFRNTYLLLLAATYAETKYPNKKVAFIIGANLTEGMVYLDNSTNYLKQFNNLIKVAGQFTNNFEVVAPFANMTKTKMLEWYKGTYVEDLLQISFSCYFPKDGKACGECGSCVLRNKAIKKLSKT